ncbi:hypothetical protein Tco_0265050 [Tanacetum coccineum]
MADLTFADSHNMVAYLEKSEVNADFTEIVDFLNASPISFAVTVSLTIYVSYIEQFWSTAKTKTVNNETQIHAKVDDKTIVITKSSVRRYIHFDDEDGITCLTNTEIFENLQLMGYEKLSDKLTFLKPFFSPQWKYLIHTILQCLSSKSTAWNEFAVFNDEYDTPSHTKKVFANMRRKGKDFLGTVTPLFPSMLASQAVDGEDEAVHEKRRDSVERAATTAASLDAEQDSGGSPRCQEAMGDTIAQTRSERVSTPSYDSPLLGVNTPGSDEERIELKELMDMCTKLSDRVLDLENPRVESSEESLGKKDASNQGRNSDKTKELNVAEDEHMFDLSNLAGTEETTKLVEDKGSAEKGVNAAKDKDSTDDPVTTAGEAVTTTNVNPKDSIAVDVSVTDDVTLAETLMAIKSTKDKGKGIMQYPEKSVKVKGKDQIEYAADVAQRLQAKLDKEVRLEREREEEASNATLIEEWDSIEARIDADAQLAERLQAEKREHMLLKSKLDC